MCASVIGPSSSSSVSSEIAFENEVPEVFAAAAAAAADDDDAAV